MNVRTQRLCAWCGPAMMVFWAVGFAVLARFVPPPGPGIDAQRMVEIIHGNTTGIRFGLILTVIGSALLGPFVGVISMQMKRIEGRDSPLAYAQLVLGACLILEFILPMATLQAATYRPERAQDIILTLTDLSWIWFFGIASTVVLEAIVFGVVILQDHRPVPRIPRWAGYVCIWAGLLFSPGSFLIFFKDGPMAWNGLLVFWVPIASFLVWMVVVVAAMIRASNATDPRQEQAQHPSEDELHRQLSEVRAELADVRIRLVELAAR